mgnify:CR=1 FL=1
MEGLNRQEVEYRENNGLSNIEKVNYTRSAKQIILSILRFFISSITVFSASKLPWISDIIAIFSIYTSIPNNKIIT